MPSSDSAWLRPLYSSEKLFAWAGYFGDYNTTLVLCLRQRQPFDASLARKAAVLWSRQNPLLQVCVRHRGITPWFHKIPSDANLDFDVVENVDISKVVNDVRYKTYDLARGPLWRARLVVLPHQASSQSEQFLLQEDVTIYRYLNQPDTELEDDVRYALLVLGVQHCITDSTTNLMLGRSYVNILSKIQSCVEVPINEIALSEFIAYKVHPLFYNQIFKIFIPVIWRMLSNALRNIIYSSASLIRPKIYDINPSKSVRYVFSSDVTQKLMANCKDKNVGLHSCVVTAVNLAYYRTVKENYPGTDTLKVEYADCINLRRYFPRHFQQVHGCHITTQLQSALVSLNSCETFWETARQSGRELQKKLNKKTPLHHLLKEPLGLLGTIVNSVTKILRISDIITYVYATSNLKDISEYFHSTSTGIDVTDVFICGTADKGSSFFTSLFHTFRGRLQLAFDYYANKIQPKHAKQIIRETAYILEALSNKESLNQFNNESGV